MNKVQYEITKEQAGKFLKAIKEFDMSAAIKRTGSIILAEAELSALKSEYENLMGQVQNYKGSKHLIWQYVIIYAVMCIAMIIFVIIGYAAIAYIITKVVKATW